MSIRQRGGGWQADVTDTNASPPKRWRPSFKTEAAAKGWAADAMAAIANGRPVPEPNATTHGTKPGSLLLETALERMYDDEYAHVTSDWPKTVKLRMNEMNKFWPGYTLAEVATPDETARFTKRLYELGNKQSTINGKLSVLSKLFKWAKERRLISDPPKVKRRKPNNMRYSYLSQEDEAEILRQAKQFELHEFHDAVVVLVDTGLRPSELFRLKGGDLRDTAKNLQVTVRQSKNGESRFVVATERVKAILARRRVSYKDGKLFPNMTQSRLRHQWDRIRENMGKSEDPEFIPYILRHTCASRMVQRGVPLGVIQKWMGHKTITITMRYAKHAPGDFDAAAEALERKIA